MVFNRYFLLAGILLILNSCKENSCNPIGSFSGITQRNAGGVIVNHDQGDWSLKDKWGEREKELFDVRYKTDCFAPSNFSILAYPNPTDGDFQLVFNKSDATHVDIRLVDSNCRTLISHNEIKKRTIGLHPGKLDKSGIVRLYYKFVEDGCEYQGHGDIMVEL